MADNAPAPAADAGASSNASTPVADAAAVNAVSGGNVTGQTGGGAEMSGEDGSNVAQAPSEPTKLGSDGEPIPVGNEAQRKVAEAIAATFKPADEASGEVHVHDVNQDLRKIIAEGQTQSMAGPKPVEQTPTEQPAPDGSPPLAKKVEVKAKGTVTPPSPKPE